MIGLKSNWLISQHISRQLPDGKLLGRVIAHFDYQHNCSNNETCKKSFAVYYWTTSTPDPVAAQNIDNYQYVNEANPEYTNVNIAIDLMSGNETGFYIAVVDLSTCLIINRVLVFYYVCPSGSFNLIKFPETPAPLYNATAECTENSSPSRTAGQLYVSCFSNGTWDIISGCECDPGLQGVSQDRIVTNCSGTDTI